MQQKNSRLRKPAIWFILTGVVVSILLFGYFKPNIIIQYQTEKPGIPPAWAASPLVTGSPNVAVTSYTTSDGKTYMLWSDSHITDTSNNSIVTASSAYSGAPPSGFTDPPSQGFGITGSGRVAIGIVPTLGATYINFSNGTVRDPGSPANNPIARGGIANVYGIVWNTKVDVRSYGYWTDTGLAITLTPTSSNSKLLINANIVAIHGGASKGACLGGLFKDSTALVVPFSTNISASWIDATAAGVTYVDPALTTSSRTYKVMVTGWCSLNMDAFDTYYGSSTMSILEI